MTFRFDPQLVSVDIDADGCEEAIHAVAGPLVRHGYVGDDYPRLVCEREREYPTGLSTKTVSLALAHADGKEQVSGDHVAVGIMRSPVCFRNMEDADEMLPVGIVFVLAMSSSHAHLEMLQVLMELMRDDVLLDSLVAMATTQEVCAALNGFIEAREFENVA